MTIQADATTNNPADIRPDPLYRNLREVIDMLDQRRAQVVIESLIVEVNEDDASEFGVQWQAATWGARVVWRGQPGRQRDQRHPTQQDQHRRAAQGPEYRPGGRLRGYSGIGRVLASKSWRGR